MRIKKYVLLFSIISVIAANINFYFKHGSLQVGARLFLHFYILAAVLLVLSLFLFFSKEEISRIVLTMLKFMVLLLIGYPLGSDILIEVILFSGIIFESVFYLKVRHSMILLSIMNIVFVLTQQETSAWYEALDSVEIHNLISAGFINIITSCSGYIIRAILKKNEELNNGMKYLNEAVLKLSDINIGFQSFVKDQEFNILLEERRRISREIHDTVGYTLTNIIMLMEVLNVTDRKDEEKHSFIINSTKEQAIKGLADTRASVRALRNKEIPQQHGKDMIYKLVSAFRLASGIDISINFGNIRDTLDYETDKIIFRFIQEGMTNVFRHGMATKIDIKFWMKEEDLRVSIEDNGRGAERIVEGVGITGMRERLQKVNGELYLSNNIHGFKAELKIPLSREKEAEYERH